MIGLGTIINSGGIVLGGIFGLLFGKLLKERHQESLCKSCGISVMFIAIAGAMEKMLAIEKGGLKVSGTSPDGKLVEYVEAPECKYFIATQAHPEFRSRPYRAHPLFEGLIRAASK